MYKHNSEDTIKNFKHATDSLTLIISENKQASYQTVRNSHVLTAHSLLIKLQLYINYQMSNIEKK